MGGYCKRQVDRTIIIAFGKGFKILSKKLG